MHPAQVLAVAHAHQMADHAPAAGEPISHALERIGQGRVLPRGSGRGGGLELDQLGLELAQQLLHSGLHVLGPNLVETWQTQDIQKRV